MQIIARSLRPMWLRVGGTEADYVTFVPPISSPHHSDSSSNNYEDDSEPGDISDFTDYSGHSTLKDGSGYFIESFHTEGDAVEHRESLPNPNYNKTSPQNSIPKTSRVSCEVEEEEDLAKSENISPTSIEMLPYEWDRLHQFAQKCSECAVERLSGLGHVQCYCSHRLQLGERI